VILLDYANRILRQIVSLSLLRLCFIPITLNIQSVQNLAGISIQGALTQKWSFPFKSMQHRSGMSVWLPKGGWCSRMATCFILCLRFSTEHHHAF